MDRAERRARSTAHPAPARPGPVPSPIPVHTELGPAPVAASLVASTAASTGMAARPRPALTGIRLRGIWLYRLACLGWDFLLRPRRHDLPADGTAPALLDLLLPGASVRTMPTAQGPALTISHPGGLTAILRPRGGTDLATALPAPAELVPSGDFGVQAVFHAGRSPRVWLAVHAIRTPGLAVDTDLTVALRRVRLGPGRNPGRAAGRGRGGERDHRAGARSGGTAASITALLAPTGVRPVRLHGIQRSGVAASLPIGGFLP